MLFTIVETCEYRGRKGPDAFFSCVLYNVGLKRDGNGEWRRLLHNEELHSLYRSPNIVRVIKSRRLIWVGHLARMEEVRSAFKILTSKPTGKRPLGSDKLLFRVTS